MSPIIRNILAMAGGLVVGSGVNMGLVLLGPMLIPPPPGVDPGNMESLAQSMHLMGPQHFLFPFLAHALGTLAGAVLAFCVAGRNPHLLAYGVGIFFLAGGIVAAQMVPAPAWFVAVDLLFAYLPMAWFATRIGANYRKSINAGI